jgi:hypothetical protein
MSDKEDKQPPSKEERRAEFAPHHNPKKQPDGDPGPTSARERAVDESGTDAPESVEDDATED